MRIQSHRLALMSLGLWLAATPHVWSQEDAKPNPAKLEFFEKKVRPLLVDNCYNCHSADNKADGGLRVDDHRGLMQGGKRGRAIVVGKPEESLLIKAVQQTDDKLKMPPNKQLTEEQVAILQQWIKDGAAWPADEIPADLLDRPAEYDRLLKQHWAWQPLQAVTVPADVSNGWARDDVDRFVWAKLQEVGLSPVADADRVTLLRRVTFDLTGLPPTPAEIRDFLADPAPTAYETVVDRLLRSPAFGERWGRHWLDVARFGESTGSARNLPFPHAWRYRDYVIDAFNKDKPYDQFIREQVAGDLLPAKTEEQRREQLIATGFLAIGVKDVNQRFKVRYIMDNIDEQIDTVSRSVMALTASCARCHDHKFDPITTSEYYSLAGIFQSSDDCAGLRNKMGGGGLDYYDPKMLLVLPGSSEPNPQHAARLAAARKAADEAKADFERSRDSADADKPAPNGKPRRQVARQKWNRLEAEYQALNDPTASGAVAMGVRDGAQIGDTEIRIRGEAEKLGPVVPRGFLKVVDFAGQPVVPTDKSGRLELAQWLTSPKNPLTSRVIVNRVWHHLFGAGLVTSVDNFGVTGDTPSHPELLDHLATSFAADGWSTKRLIRRLVLTRAYGLSSLATERHQTLDPANRWVWRHSPRRLEAEEMRDATLAAAGVLDRSRPQGSAAAELKVVELPNNGAESQRLLAVARASHARSVYLPLLRTLVPTSLEVFDFADQGLVTGSRETTTVPTQALYLLNDAFVRRNSLVLAESLLAATDMEDRGRIEAAYLSVVGRSPSQSEVERVQFYLQDYQAAAHEALAAEFTAVAQREAKAQAARQRPADACAPLNIADETPAGGGAKVVTDQGAGVAVKQAEPPPKLEPVQPRDARTAAWASFVQALLGSGDFRYVR
ncbi:MAG: PSD1 domain-containing protein [Planctomycetes bacterium]|nr:PSD1 domain-containing protein [Planctomycetota bacterium]